MKTQLLKQSLPDSLSLGIAMIGEKARSAFRESANLHTGAASRHRHSAPPGTPVCCILGASFGTGNLGVSALAASTVASVLSSFPNARVFFLDYGRTSATYQVKHGEGVASVELVNLRFSWRLHLRNNIARLLLTALVLKLVPSNNYRERLIRRNPYLSQIKNADIIGSLAGGDSFSDIYGMRRFFYVALPQLMVLLLDKPLILLPQTLGPFKGLAARTVAGFILRRAEQVYARDAASLDEVRPFLKRNPAKADFSHDMAFMLEPVQPVKLPDWSTNKGQDTPLVGLNVSGLLYGGGYTGNNMFGLKSDYKELVWQIVGHFIDQKGARVVLMPHVFGSADGCESDPAANAAVYRDLGSRYPGKLTVVSEAYNQHEMKYLIGQCDFFLGSRMHACIAALSQGVPAVGLAYSKKFLGVLRTVGAESLVADLREHDAAETIALIDRAYASREEIKSRLTQQMPAIRQAAAGLFARISPGGKSAAMSEIKTRPVPIFNQAKWI